MNDITQIKDKIQKINELISELENDLLKLNLNVNSSNTQKHSFSQEAKAIDVYKKGKFVETLPSISQTAKRYKLSYSTVWEILKNKRSSTRKYLSFKFSSSN